jgi:hypothetical protein
MDNADRSSEISITFFRRSFFVFLAALLDVQPELCRRQNERRVANEAHVTTKPPDFLFLTRKKEK